MYTIRSVLEHVNEKYRYLKKNTQQPEVDRFLANPCFLGGF